MSAATPCGCGTRLCKGRVSKGRGPGDGAGIVSRGLLGMSLEGAQ